MQLADTIATSLRSTLGTGSARALRREDKVPLAVYSKGNKTMHLVITQKDALSVYKHSRSSVAPVKIGVDQNNFEAYCKHIERHPVTEEIMHIELLRVDPTSRVEVRVPLVVKNAASSNGIKQGGIINLSFKTLKCRLEPGVSIDAINIDVAGMNMGAIVRISDLDIPQGVEPLNKDPRQTILRLVGKKKGKATEANEGAPSAS